MSPIEKDEASSTSKGKKHPTSNRYNRKKENSMKDMMTLKTTETLKNTAIQQTLLNVVNK